MNGLWAALQQNVADPETTKEVITKVLEKFGKHEGELIQELQKLILTHEQFVSFSELMRYITFVLQIYNSGLVMTNNT